MKETSLIKKLEAFYEMCPIPMICYQYSSKRYSIGIPEVLSEVNQRFLKVLLSSKKSNAFLTTPNFLFYGQLSLPFDHYIIHLGPAISIYNLNEQVTNIAQTYDVTDSSSHRQLSRAIRQLPDMNSRQFLSAIRFLYYSLTNENTPDMADLTYQHFNLQETKNILPLRKTYFEFSAEMERQVTYLIGGGDVSQIDAVFHSAALENVLPDFQMNELRFLKDMTILTITSISRMAVQFGVPYSESLSACYDFINDLEQQQTGQKIYELTKEVFRYYIEEVGRYRQFPDASSLIRQTTRYILSHMLSPLTLSEIAGAVNVSPSYLSSQFHLQTKMTLRQYVREKKLEAAAYMLSNSNHSIRSIASALCFSSSQYFQNVFRKEYGMTPGEYRNEHRSLNH